MNLSVSDSVGFVGGLILIGALLLALVIVATLFERLVRGRDDTPIGSEYRVRDDNDIV